MHFGLALRCWRWGCERTESCRGSFQVSKPPSFSFCSLALEMEEGGGFLAPGEGRKEIMQVEALMMKNIEFLMNDTIDGRAENRAFGTVGDEQGFLHGLLEEQASLENLYIKRSKLHAELEIMEKVLKGISDEEQRQKDLKTPEKGGQNIRHCQYTGDVKRCRRPNPKYFSHIALLGVTQAPTLDTSHMNNSTITGSIHVDKQQSRTTDANEDTSALKLTGKNSVPIPSDYIQKDSVQLGRFTGTLTDVDCHSTKTNILLKPLSMKKVHENFESPSLKDNDMLINPEIFCGLLKYNVISDSSLQSEAIMKDTLLQENSNDEFLTEHISAPYGDILIRGSRAHTNELFEAASGAKLLSGGILKGQQCYNNCVSMLDIPTTCPMSRSLLASGKERNDALALLDVSTNMHTCKKRQRKHSVKHLGSERNSDSGRAVVHTVTVTSNSTSGGVF